MKMQFPKEERERKKRILSLVVAGILILIPIVGWRIDVISRTSEKGIRKSVASEIEKKARGCLYGPIGIRGMTGWKCPPDGYKKVRSLGHDLYSYKSSATFTSGKTSFEGVARARVNPSTNRVDVEFREWRIHPITGLKTARDGYFGGD